MWSVVVALGVLGVVGAVEPATLEASARVVEEVSRFAEVSGLPPRIIVTLDHSSTAEAVDKLLGTIIASGGEDLTNKVNMIPLRQCVMVVLEVLHGATYQEVQQIVQTVMAIDGVVAVEADALIQTPMELVQEEPDPLQTPSDIIPNDYYWSLQWGLVSLQTPAAWEVVTGEEIGAYRPLVTVIDSGIDYNHPDLAANVWTNEAEANGIEGVDDDGNGYVDDIHGWNAILNLGDPMDDYWHGTHVAGILGARTNNGQGVAGVHWQPLVQGCKFLNENGSGSTSGAVICIDYSIACGSWISNNSWGSGGFSVGLDAAITRSRQAGQLFVCSAGNSGRNITEEPYYPPSYAKDHMVAVANLAKADDLLGSSNYGVHVHLAAPGQDIASLYPGGGYAYGTGTSMSAPHVAGVALLLKTLQPDLTAAGAIDILMSSVAPFGATGLGAVEWEGKLDALLAVEIGATTTTTTTTSTTTTTTTVTTTTTTSLTDCPSTILAPSTITCEDSCAMRGLDCDEVLTSALNTNLDQCYDEAANLGISGSFVKDEEDNSSVAFPSGCYATFWKGVYSVSRNTYGYGTTEVGCRAPPSAMAGSLKICKCETVVNC